MINSVVIKQTDNVAVAIEELAANTQGSFLLPEGFYKNIEVVDNIPIYHKFAIQSIPNGAPIIKYGEYIGFAGTNIKEGQHVHSHNVISKRKDFK